MCPKTHTDTLVNSKIGGKMDVHPPRIWYHKVQLQPDFGTMQFCNSFFFEQKNRLTCSFCTLKQSLNLPLFDFKQQLPKTTTGPAYPHPNTQSNKNTIRKNTARISCRGEPGFSRPRPRLRYISDPRSLAVASGVVPWQPKLGMSQLPRLWISVVKKNSPRATLWMCSIWKRHTQDMAHKTKFGENTNLMCSHHLNAVKMAKTEGKYM